VISALDRPHHALPVDDPNHIGAPLHEAVDAQLPGATESHQEGLDKATPPLRFVSTRQFFDFQAKMMRLRSGSHRLDLPRCCELFFVSDG
jgi:hypothetical protein